jgi:hypothetical protein
VKRFLIGAALCATSSSVVLAQANVTFTDIGPGPAGRLVRAALQKEHRLVPPDSAWFVLTRGEVVRTSLIVLGRTAAIEGHVVGDVIVVDGDLHIRPGGRISGRAIAIGGGVYPSALAVLEGGRAAYRDNTYSITRTSDGYALAYLSLREHDSPALSLAGVYGLRIPSYDRVNGLSLPVGLAFSLLGGRLAGDVLATYRSDLGEIDPSAAAAFQWSRRLRIRASAARASYTNDAWIWSNFVNSAAAIATGTDTRNYYRADRVELSAHRLWETSSTQFEPWIGGLLERAWSVGPSIGDQRGPWSIFGRSDSLGMLRPNPPIDPGGVTSALAGGFFQWDAQQMTLRARSRGELNITAPGDRRFTQITTDVDVTFPTFGVQTYQFQMHVVTTFGETPPAQRFAYLGGSGTLDFLDLLEQGGDELFLIDQRYAIPLLWVRLGLLGSPTIVLKHRLGSAGLGSLPDFESQLGLAVNLTFIRGELQTDPASGKVRLSVGFSFAR